MSQESPSLSSPSDLATAEAERACEELKTHIATARRLVEDARRVLGAGEEPKSFDP